MKVTSLPVAETQWVGDLRAMNILAENVVTMFINDSTECLPITVVIEYGSRTFSNFFEFYYILNFFALFEL